MERYRVNILGLSLSTHHFEYDLGPEFLKKYDSGLVSEGTFKVQVDLDKRETFLDANFSIKGSVKLVCDRSLDEFDYPGCPAAYQVCVLGDRYKQNEIVN